MSYPDDFDGIEMDDEEILAELSGTTENTRGHQRSTGDDLDSRIQGLAGLNGDLVSQSVVTTVAAVVTGVNASLRMASGHHLAPHLLAVVEVLDNLTDGAASLLGEYWTAVRDILVLNISLSELAALEKLLSHTCDDIEHARLSEAMFIHDSVRNFLEFRLANAVSLYRRLCTLTGREVDEMLCSTGILSSRGRLEKRLLIRPPAASER